MIICLQRSQCELGSAGEPKGCKSRDELPIGSQKWNPKITPEIRKKRNISKYKNTNSWGSTCSSFPCLSYQVCVCVCACVCVCFLGPNQKTNLLRYGGPSMVTCGNLVGSEDQLFSCATTQGASNARLLSGNISGWPVVKWDTVVKYGINIPVRWICYGSGHNEVTLIQKIHPHKIQRQNGPRKTSCKWGEMPYNPRELRV